MVSGAARVLSAAALPDKICDALDDLRGVVEVDVVSPVLADGAVIIGKVVTRLLRL